MKELQVPFDSAWILKNRRKIKKALLADGTPRMEKKIAVLGGSTTNDIVSMLELFLLDNGIQPSFYQSEYARYWQDAMFENPELEAFQPDLIFIHTTSRNITEFPEDVYCPAETVEAALERQYTHFTQMWDRLAEGYHCPIIQNNFELPAIPDFAYNLTRIIRSIYGKNKKVLALDLDNTLWGGVIGDDGQEGIEIGHETSMGQAYEELQGYLKQQKKIGVLLTVCSKNEPENALLGLNHPSGVLKPDDFVTIKANWEPKDRNLVETAAELNLLPESIVFVDDNPAERAIVSGQIPGVAVPEFDCVEDCLRQLDRAGYFEVTSLSSDDAKRNAMYQANAQRAQMQKTFADYTDYLNSLEMQGTIRDFEPIYLQRIVQLTNKSNQFNLTTKRYTQSEMETVAASDRYIRLYGRLEDKFGDNGIVSVVIGEKVDDALHMDLWLMSCRVLKRDMEFAMLDELVRQCREQGIQNIVGYYYKTAKNAMVKDLYGTFGFTKTKDMENGDSVWELNVADYTNKNHVITVNQKECAEQ